MKHVLCPDCECPLVETAWVQEPLIDGGDAVALVELSCACAIKRRPVGVEVIPAETVAELDDAVETVALQHAIVEARQRALMCFLGLCGHASH